MKRTWADYSWIALGAGVLVFTLSMWNRLTFPVPWNDEARFYVPALWWANHFNLEPASLNAPMGIFWVPDGFTILLGSGLTLFGKSIYTARLICEVMVSVSVALWSLSFRRIAGSSYVGALCTILIVSPSVVFAANMVRMEAPLMLLLAIVVLVYLNGARAEALSLLLLSVLIHPAFAVAACAYLLSLLLLPRRSKSKLVEGKWSYICLVATVILFACEVIRYVHHYDVYKLHMAFQVSRKAGRDVMTVMLSKAMLVDMGYFALVAVSMFLARGARWSPTILARLPIVAIGVGVMLYAVFGFEIAYGVYSFALVPALFVSVASGIYLAGVDSTRGASVRNVAAMD